LLEWNPAVTDIREQFPLRLEDTLILAEEANIRHPEVGGYTKIMSSDFVVDLFAPSGPERLAIQVKDSSDLKDPRTVENLDILYSARVQSESLEILFNSLPVYVDSLEANPNTKLPDIGMLIDRSYSLEAGTSLARLRALMALRALTFDISTPWSRLVARDLQVVEDITLLRASYAANQ